MRASRRDHLQARPEREHLRSYGTRSEPVTRRAVLQHIEHQFRLKRHTPLKSAPSGRWPGAPAAARRGFPGEEGQCAHAGPASDRSAAGAGGQAGVARASSLSASGEHHAVAARSGAYTFIDARIERSNNPAEVGKKFQNTPRNSASIWATYTARRFTLGVGPRFMGAVTATTRTPAIVDALRDL